MAKVIINEDNGAMGYDDPVAISINPVPATSTWSVQVLGKIDEGSLVFSVDRRKYSASDFPEGSRFWIDRETIEEPNYEISGEPRLTPNVMTCTLKRLKT